MKNIEQKILMSRMERKNPGLGLKSKRKSNFSEEADQQKGYGGGSNPPN